MTVDINVNGILNVSAQIKMSNQITITNKRGTLPQDGIDRMVQEAEEVQSGGRRTS